jgi:ribosomal protein S18 acetylase RimI-like enzyme
MPDFLIAQNQPKPLRISMLTRDSTASVSVWPPMDGVSMVGDIAAPKGGLSSDDRHVLMRAAETMARNRWRARYAVGPMDGATWRHYRALTKGEGPPLPGEPPYRQEWSKTLKERGWAPVLEFITVEASMQDLPDEEPTEIDGIVFGPPRPRDAMPGADCTDDAFSEAPFFSPVDRKWFDGVWQRSCRATPETVVARDGNQVAGYSLAFPHPGDPKTTIMKTLAVASSHRGLGLGKELTMRSIRAARAAGRTRALFMLMREDNVSARWALRYGREIRRHALFGKELA